MPAMARVGVVLSCEEDGSATVAASPRGACGHCSERGGCGFVLMQPKDDGRDVLVVENPVQARPGDMVELDLPGGTELKVSMAVWGLPLLGLIGGAVAGVAAHGALGLSEDVAALLGCGLGLVAAWLLLRLVDRRAGADPDLTPRIRRVVEDRACEHHATGAGPES
jgi:sigma-E factor negative regulatory protein RseC